MPARWMEGKLIKQRRMRRAWARPLSVKSGIQPNRDVIQQYQRTAKGLGVEEARTRFPNVAPGRHDIQDRIDEILQQFEDPMFITLVDNLFQRCRLYFNSQKNVCVLQHVDWRSRVVRISISYPKLTRARHAFESDSVRWRIKKDLPAPHRTA